MSPNKKKKRKPSRHFAMQPQTYKQQGGLGRSDLHDKLILRYFLIDGYLHLDI